MRRMVGPHIKTLRSQLTLIAVYINNHTSVWGSWYDVATSQWGYVCCHSTVHISYCTGQVGIEATHASSAQNLLASSSELSASTTASSSALPEASTNEASEDRRRKAESLFSKKRLGEGELELDESRLADAIKAERKRKGRGGDEYEWGTGKKRKGGDTHEVTEEELGMCMLRCRTVVLISYLQRRTG